MHARLEHLFVKAARGAPMEAVPAARLLTGLGIEGDIGAHWLSPRQVLVTLDTQLHALSLAPGALRENLVIGGVDEQQFRPGAALIGESGIEIGLTMYCEPCRQLQPLLPERALATLIGQRGILGVVRAGGPLRRGETLRLLPQQHPALADSVFQKFLDFVPAIPPGRVLRYADIALALGADRSFIRAIPGYIRRAAAADAARALPLHRIVNGRGEPSGQLADQAARLMAEGVLSSGRIDLGAFLWQGPLA